MSYTLVLFRFSFILVLLPWARRLHREWFLLCFDRVYCFHFWICVCCRFRVCTCCFILKIDRILWPLSGLVQSAIFSASKNRRGTCYAQSRPSAKTQLNLHLTSIAFGLRDTFVHLPDDNTRLKDLYWLRLPVDCWSVKDLNLSSTAAVVKPWPWAERLWCSPADATALEINFSKGARDYRVNV